MATITFHGVDLGDLRIHHLAGSGLGFYGSSFGQSVAVSEYQDTTYITDSTGSNEGPALVNTKWVHESSGINSTVGTDPIDLQHIPNRLSTLEIRFTHGSAVNVQNAKLRIFDRSNINNPASGVTTKVAEIIHPNPTQGAGGSGDATWNTPAGSDVMMDLVDSPGMSGVNAMANNTSKMHSWYTVLSAEPDSIGSKLFALYVQCEYL